MAIAVRECKYGEVAEFRRLEGEYHYMGESHGAGDTIIIMAMMVARTLGMWVCARSPGKTTAEVRIDLLRHPSKLLRIMMKGGLQ